MPVNTDFRALTNKKETSPLSPGIYKALDLWRFVSFLLLLFWDVKACLGTPFLKTKTTVRMRP